MLCPAAVSAAAAALWLLAVLGPGLCLPAEGNSELGFNLCSHCFYRQTPPQGASAGPLLRPLCHRRPGGQSFATLYKPTCDTAVYSAFHLSHGQADRGEEGEELVEEENVKVVVPALLRGGEDPPQVATDSQLQQWDSTFTTLVQSSVIPQCNTLGGDLYILTGAGRLGAAEDGNEECQAKLLWSAVCCVVPEGKESFSVGLIRETDGEERQVSVEELEEILGVIELFSEGCRGANGQAVEVVIGHHSEAEPRNVETLESDAAGMDTRAKELDSDSDDVRSDTYQSSYGSETVDDLEKDTNSSSILVYILSTTVSILTAPLRPVISTITELPGQVTYVLQEDLGVLSALPGDTLSFFHLLTSDLLSWMGSAVDMVLSMGDTCLSNTYYCTSSMLGALLNSCHTGVTGVGTLAGDTVGIFSDVLDNTWWVTKFFGRRLWEQSEGYVGTVMTEMGGQAKAVGGGVGKLVWRSGCGVGNVFRMTGGVIMGVVDVIIAGKETPSRLLGMTGA
uniref:INO80 complex subunit E n=1 Tax=Sphaeramia orbicularis TaxID=375764 RepID=A0A673BVI8_9TELE